MDRTFTIIIPTFNRADFISKTIYSVLSQTYIDFELIIVDDGSTDNTEQIVNTFVDQRIRYYKKKNEERAVARNFGIDKATGAYVTFLDSDDLLYPNHFEEAHKLVKEHNSPEWFHLAYEIKDENGRILRQEDKRSGNINKKLLTGNHLSCIGVFIRNDIVKANKFNENHEIIGSEDYELWLRLASKYSLYYSNEITSCIIQHSNRSVISSFNDDHLINRISKIIDVASSSSLWDRNECKRFISHRFIYLALHLAMNGSRGRSFKYLYKAISVNYYVVFSKKFWAIVKENLP